MIHDGGVKVWVLVQCSLEMFSSTFPYLGVVCEQGNVDRAYWDGTRLSTSIHGLQIMMISSCLHLNRLAFHHWSCMSRSLLWALLLARAYAAFLVEEVYLLAKCHVYSQFYVRPLDLCSACLYVSAAMHDTLHWLSFPAACLFNLIYLSI